MGFQASRGVLLRFEDCNGEAAGARLRSSVQTMGASSWQRWRGNERLVALVSRHSMRYYTAVEEVRER